MAIVKTVRSDKGTRAKDWKPDKDDRDNVMLMRASGLSKQKIASTIGVTEFQLMTHCEYELSVGYGKKKLKQLRNLEKAADSGNVAAQKALLTIYTKGELIFDVLGRPKDTPEVKAAKLGKKEQNLIEAKKGHKGTSWEDNLTRQ